MGEEFLDVKPAGLSKIILITDDQSDADSGQMMQAAEFMNTQIFIGQRNLDIQKMI